MEAFSYSLYISLMCEGDSEIEACITREVTKWFMVNNILLVIRGECSEDIVMVEGISI